MNRSDRRRKLRASNNIKGAFGSVNNCSYWERDYLKVIPKSKRKEKPNE